MKKTKSDFRKRAELYKKNVVWLRADYEFSGLFSYKLPVCSGQHAEGSPIPSPSTIKKSLVSAAIKKKLDKREGSFVFDIVKFSKVFFMPPEIVVKSNQLLKRLKEREKHLIESIGTRDYFMFEGPLSVYIEVLKVHAEHIKYLLEMIDYIGTSDSYCWCSGVVEEEPKYELCAMPFEELSKKQNITITNSFPVVGLTDFNANVVKRNRPKLSIKPYILPLVDYGKFMKREPLYKQL